MNDSYTVERHPHGIVCRGPIPIDDLSALLLAWHEMGYRLCDSVIAKKLGASMVVTRSAAERDAWRAELGIVDGEQLELTEKERQA